MAEEEDMCPVQATEVGTVAEDGEGMLRTRRLPTKHLSRNSMGTATVY
jgi:hypothetical protein